MLLDSKELKELIELISRAVSYYDGSEENKEAKENLNQKADDAWEKLVKKFSWDDSEETKCEKSEVQDNDEDKSYFVKTYDRYVDGVHVDHSLEEYKNGKCVRSDGFNNKIEADEPKLCFQDSECKCDCHKARESQPTVKYDDYKKLEAKLKEFEERNAELEKKVKDSDDKLKIINSILTPQ